MAATVLGGEKAKGIVYRESNKQLVVRLRRLTELNPTQYTQKFIGAQVGTLTEEGKPYSGSYVSTYLSGKCSGEKWEPALTRWLEIEEAERARERAGRFFLKNDFTYDVLDWIDRAWRRRVCVAITSDPGMGKTETRKDFAAAKRDVFPIQAGPTRANAWAIENAAIDIIGEDNPELDTAINRADQLVRFFCKFPRMIFIDDFDLLHRSAFEFLLRDLWNQARIPIVLFGNKQGIDKLDKLPRQLSSRIRHVHLTATFNKAIVAQFLRHHLDGVEVTGGMISIAHSIANLDGAAHFRTLLDLCQDVHDDVKDGDTDPEIAFKDRWEKHRDYKIAVSKGRAPAISAAAERELVTA